jgi:hypothetical protein
MIGSGAIRSANVVAFFGYNVAGRFLEVGQLGPRGL